MAENTVQTSPPKASAPHRPPRPMRVRRSFLLRLGQAARAWAANTFSRDQLIAGLKSMPWVIPMTVLIWVYAEREEVVPESVTFYVQPRNADSSRLVELGTTPQNATPLGPVEVHAEISGPKEKVDQVVERLTSVSGAIAREIGGNLAPGAHVIPLANLNDDPYFVKNGVSLSKLQPSEFSVYVDPIIQVDAEVKADPKVTNLEGPVIFDPPTVRVSGPESILASRQGKLIAYAELGQLNEPGAKNIANVPVTLSITGRDISISPTTVSAKFSVKKSDVEDVIPSIPVWVEYPPGQFWDKYRAVYDHDISDVKVTGPADVIRDLKNPAHEPRPKAIFDPMTAIPPINTANPTGVDYFAQKVSFDFGDTAVKISPDDTHKTIKFNIVERKSE